MAFSKVYSGAVIGMEPHLVEVEINIDYQGFPGFTIVGLPSKEVDEAKERVRSAIKNSGYQFPPRRITVNLAPADIPKRGSLYDLPIAVGILAASGTINTELLKENAKYLKDYMIVGELSLNGNVNSINGLLPMVFFAKNKFSKIVVPEENAQEALVIKELQAKPVRNLKDLVQYFIGEKEIKSPKHIRLKDQIKLIQDNKTNKKQSRKYIDFKYIKGQEMAKRAIEIAAAGGHNISLTGPPGSGKTILSKALMSILPPMSEKEALETTNIYSIAGETSNGEVFIIEKPFRSPHHSSSKAGLIGGGNPIKPGEVSFAHNGVLFLDEFPEFSREHIESLRLPMEEKEITITRATGSITFPCNFILVTASNPCPCGNLGHPKIECVCSDHRIKYYREKMSGPIFDRIDLHINCLPIDHRKLASMKSSESSKDIRKRVFKAVKIQNARYVEDLHVSNNSSVSAENIQKYLFITDETKIYLQKLSVRFNLSARAFHKVIKVSRTIADLENSNDIKKKHIAEAIQYRFIV